MPIFCKLKKSFFVLRRPVLCYSYGGRPTSGRNSCLGSVLFEPISRLLLHLLESKGSLGAHNVLTHCLARFIGLTCTYCSINKTVQLERLVEVVGTCNSFAPALIKNRGNHLHQGG